jgi:nucleoid-associated protein YgaU
MTKVSRQGWKALLICGALSLSQVANAQEDLIDAQPAEASEAVVEETLTKETLANEAATKKPTPIESVYHKVRSGESLWIIALENLGEGSLWPALYRANRDQIQNPKILYPGQELAIPNIAPEEKEAIRAEAAQLNTQ